MNKACVYVMAGVLDTAQILSPVGTKPPPGFINGITTKVSTWSKIILAYLLIGLEKHFENLISISDSFFRSFLFGRDSILVFALFLFLFHISINFTSNSILRKFHSPCFTNEFVCVF